MVEQKRQKKRHDQVRRHEHRGEFHGDEERLAEVIIIGQHRNIVRPAVEMGRADQRPIEKADIKRKQKWPQSEGKKSHQPRGHKKPGGGRTRSELSACGRFCHLANALSAFSAAASNVA